ncbi:MAG: hypothetical protein C4341_09935 [Armatimonadota bacterium]
MDDRELSIQAEHLLRQARRDPERPHYGEQWFRRKLRIARYRDRRLAPELQPAESVPRELLLRELDRHLMVAGLTPLQRAVLADHLLGRTWVEVAARNGHSKQAAQQAFRAAVRKIQSKRACDPYAGLSEVYRAEVSRRGRTV